MNRIRCFCFLATALSACPILAQTPGDRLVKLFDDEWEYTLRESPTFASHLGDKRYNDRWADVSPSSMMRRHAHQLLSLIHI